jgi:hypothetical protein
MSGELERMKQAWESMGIASDFPRVHHFASPKFKTPSCGLERFYNWCVVRDIQEENAQTINRALEVVRLLSAGLGLDEAIRKAWDSYPVRTR